jgi:hypothetical protein
MKHNVNFFRLIEYYFDGTITNNEKDMLFEQLQRDPLLKAEFDLQQDIIAGLQTKRTEQLKASLAAIEVPSVVVSSGNLYPMQFIASAVILISAALSALWWYTDT